MIGKKHIILLLFSTYQSMVFASLAFSHMLYILLIYYYIFVFRQNRLKNNYVRSSVREREQGYLTLNQ